MQLLNQPARHEGSYTVRRALSVMVAGIVLAACQPLLRPANGQVIQLPQVPGGRTSPDQDSAAGVYLPTDRAMMRALDRVRERLEKREFHEALPFLQNILARSEDVFLERSGGDRDQPGLKATARQLIGGLPAEGVEAYELLHGAMARRNLEAALKTSDRDGVAEVVRQFYHTTAGYEATFILAQMEADQGHRLAAAQLYQELIDTPRSAARFEPQLSVAAALNELAAGKREAAARLLSALQERTPASQITLLGKSFPLPAKNADPLAWLTGIVGEVRAVTASDESWATLRGNAARNMQSPGGKPHLRPRWEARVVNDPTIESVLANRSADFLQRGAVAIPGARPIAVGDVIVMRTHENVVAIDWHTGKRIWETRDEQELDSENAPADLVPGTDHDLLSTQSRELEERVWDDALASSLSSDGSRVFVVRGSQPSPDPSFATFQIKAVFGQMGGLENATLSNQLTAYDLATQGKLAWELDGGRSVGPLAGAFFLGPPLAIDSTLFGMAEIRGALYLLALDPATGSVTWQQQLVGLEQGIALDPARRRTGVTPSYSGGILVCPTAAGAVIGVDVVRRELAWVYRYSREAPTAAEVRNLWQQQQLQNQLVRPNDQWLDGSAIIADDRVVLTPPESEEIFCLDLRTGKLQWKGRRSEALFVGAVDRGTVLLIGTHTVQALRLSDGTPAWKQESVPLPSGALPVGQGYIGQGRYFLPLSSGQVAEVDIASGNTSCNDRVNPDIALGNLIFYRGSVISQSACLLDKFEQLDLLQQRAEAALAQNPNDANALRELAEIKIAAGDNHEAIRVLRRAFELSPQDLATQEMLVESLLTGLAEDYATFRADVPLVTKLVHTREQRIELLRINAAGLDTPETRLAAWDAYLRLADFTAEEPAYLTLEDRYTVRSDRWIAGRLGAIWTSATQDERQQLSQKVAERRPARTGLQTAAELRHFLAHWGELPAAHEVRLALANFLIERNRLAEAEIELLQLLTVDDPATQATARTLLAKLATGSDNRTSSAPAGWPRGQIETQFVPNTAADSAQERARQASPMVERQNGYRLLRIEQEFGGEFSDIQWFIATDTPEVVGRDAAGQEIARWNLDRFGQPRQRDNGMVRGARLGHLLFLDFGGPVIALDARQVSMSANAEPLWPSRGSEEVSADPVRFRRALLASVRTSRPPVYHNYSGRKRIAGTAGSLGALGPVTPRGVVVQDQDELRCVDPLTGTTLWSRSDVPAGCELFGDSELVFAADITNHVAHVLRLSDGVLLDRRELPKAEWLLTTGRKIAQIRFTSDRQNGAAIVTVTDSWTQNTVYQAEFAATARFSTIEPNWIAVFEPSGALHVLDVGSGRVVVDRQLEPAPELQSIQAYLSKDNLFLGVSAQTQSQFKSIGQADFPLVNGQIYAFRLPTGEALWPGPAVVRNRGLVLQQPTDLPLLVFADRQLIRNASSGGGSRLRVLCLDRQTGQTVYRNDALPDTSVTRFRIRSERTPPSTVVLEMSAGKILLAMTDRPRPPQPPANDDLEAPRDDGERGLRGLGQRMGNALRGAFERSGPGPAPQGPPQRQLPDGAPPVPAPANPADPDDD